MENINILASGISPEVLMSGFNSNNLVFGKYYLIEQDSRFPLQPTGEWKSLLEATKNSAHSIYILSGYGVQYIGMDSNGTRPKDHRGDFLRDDHDNPYMQNVVNTHGISGFFYQELVKLPKDCIQHINIIENAYIKHFDTYHNGYNLAEFSGTSFLGRKHSEESKRKMSKARKGIGAGKKLSAEHKKQISEKVKGKKHPLYGIGHTDETKRKMSLSRIGKKISEQHKNKISLAMSGENNPFYGKKHTGETLQKLSEKASKPFKIISPEGKIFEGKNISKFARENNLNLCSICNVINKKTYSHKGWTLFLSEEEKQELEKKKIDGKQRQKLSNQKPYKLLSPEGVIYEGINIFNFCQDNKFHYGHILKLLNGRSKQYKGWTLP